MQQNFYETMARVLRIIDATYVARTQLALDFVVIADRYIRVKADVVMIFSVLELNTRGVLNDLYEYRLIYIFFLDVVESSKSQVKAQYYACIDVFTEFILNATRNIYIKINYVFDGVEKYFFKILQPLGCFIEVHFNN